MTIPDSCVSVSIGRHHDCSHDGGDVEGWPLRHESIEKHLLIHSLIASFLHLVLNGNSPWIVNGIWLVTIIVGLNQKPSGIRQLVGCMYRVSVSFNDCSFVCSHSRHDEVNRTSNSLSFQPFDCSRVVSLLSKCLPQEPKSRNGVILQDADQVINEVLSISCVTVDCEGSLTNTGEGEDTANDNIAAKDELVSSIVLNIGQQFCEKFPHFKVQVSAVNHFSFRGSNQQSSACSEGRVFIHEVEEEDLIEGQITQSGNSINFFNKILMNELIFRVPLNSIIESFRDRKQLNEFDEAVKSLVECLDNWLPSCQRWIVNLYFESEGHMGLNRSNVWHHCCLGDGDEGDCNQPTLTHRIINQYIAQMGISSIKIHCCTAKNTNIIALFWVLN